MPVLPPELGAASYAPGQAATLRPLCRVLIVDDSPSIHEDFRKILAPRPAREGAGLGALETELFGSDPGVSPDEPSFQVDAASNGAEGVALVSRAVIEQKPYALAFVDLRMPPGLNGVETINRIWEIDPRVQIVVCTAYADGSWEQTAAGFGGGDRVMLMEKPFAGIEVRRIAGALTERWLGLLSPTPKAVP